MLIRKCKLTEEPFEISDWEISLLNKLDIPLPDLSANERHRRRLAYRNERKLYRNKCTLTSEPIISIYSSDKEFKVLSQNTWWGDTWSAQDYGQEIDFSRPFFEQFFELRLKVPRIALNNTNGENSEYCNNTTNNKNCYLVFGGDFNQDCSHSLFCMNCKDSRDVFWASNCELVYECIDVKDCYDISYSQNTINSRESSFLYDCKNCHHCLGCVNLTNASYCIFNKQFTASEYNTLYQQYKLNTFTGVRSFQDTFSKFRLKFPHRENQIINCENCSGDHIIGAKNCINCFDVAGPSRDLKDCFLAGFNGNDILSSCHAGHNAELYYEVMGCIQGYNCAFCTYAWSAQNCYYCDQVINSHDLFGCINMKSAKYSILNKSYSKNDYEKLRVKLINHMKETKEWGQFFPIEHSPFAYNESVAQDYFPLSKEEALNYGLNWKDDETIISKSKFFIPDSINDIADSIIKESLICIISGKPYKIIQQELDFYRQHQIPIPRIAPEIRNENRIAKRRSLVTYNRQCMSCSNQISTVFPIDAPEIVYCNSCFEKDRYVD